jgi:hypothetical protein
MYFLVYTYQGTNECLSILSIILVNYWINNNLYSTSQKHLVWAIFYIIINSVFLLFSIFINLMKEKERIKEYFATLLYYVLILFIQFSYFVYFPVETAQGDLWAGMVSLTFTGIIIWALTVVMYVPIPIQSI